MAGEDRTQTQHLAFLLGLADDARRIGLFPAVRGAESRAQNLPKVGQSKLPSQNIVDLVQQPGMSFAASTIAEIQIQPGTGRAKLSGYWLGLTGPMGPLPTHLSEFAFYEKRYASSQPFSDWLDLLAGRMLQLFYRAWADSQPAAICDRPGSDIFSVFLSALSGSMEGANERSPFPPRARAHYTPLYLGARSATAIEDSLSHLLGQKVRLLEFQPRWRDLEDDDRSRLGKSYATLGGDVVLGNRVRSASDAFRVVIRAGNMRDYKTLLPSGERFAIAAAALDSFKPSHLEWDICLEVDEGAIAPARLDGRSQLGWTGWVGKRTTKKRGVRSTIRADAHLRKIKKTPQRISQ